MLQCYFSGATVLCANWNPPSHARLKLNLLCGDVMKEMGVLEKIDPLASEQEALGSKQAFENCTHIQYTSVRIIMLLQSFRMERI